MKTTIAAVAAVLAVVLLLSRTASATSPMGKQFAQHYECPRPKCSLCHTGKEALNEYGEALKKALNGEKVITPAMFKACESKRPKS